MNKTLNRDPSEHLTDEEFVNSVLENLPEELEEQIDQHLEYCVACAQRLEDFYAAEEAFPAERWAAEREEFIARLRHKVLGPPPIWKRGVSPSLPEVSPRLPEVLRQMTQTLRAALRQPGWAVAASPQAEAQVLWDWESPDRRYHAHLVRQVNGDLTFRIASMDSSDLALAGRRIGLRCNFSGRILAYEAVLERKSETQVGAEIEIPAYEQPAPLTDISIDLADATR